MSKTPIEWTERTWNPVRGCSPVSPGCAHCYAEKTAGRFCGPGKPFDGFVQIGKNGQPGPHWTGKVELVEHMLNVPYSVRKPTTWFVNSMSDLFHEELPDEVIDRVFAVMALCPQHTFQVLTKRSKRMFLFFRNDGANEDRVGQWMATRCLYQAQGSTARPAVWPLPNVWLGVSVEDQQRADERIPDLLRTPAAVRFISGEPLLGPVDLSRYVDMLGQEFCQNCGDGERRFLTYSDIKWTRKGDGRCSQCGAARSATGYDPVTGDFKLLHWVIVGGESGPGARPFNIAWARSIVRQCSDAGVPCFVKQLGADPFQDVRCTDRSGIDQSTGLRIWPHSQTLWQNGCEAHTKLGSKKGGDMAEWPADLRVRQTPVPR